MKDVIWDIVDRCTHMGSRADELASLRRRLHASPDADELPVEMKALALELRERRQAVLDALGDVQSCRGCARGHPLPHGRWAGGHCCGGRTEYVFNDTELVALKLGGTISGDLRPPRSDHAGCAFRGPTGCSLKTADRPSICVRYLCRDLMGELAQRGDLRRVLTLCMELDAAFKRFQELLAREQSSFPLPGEPDLS